ncbi:hypothetical protein PR048_000978 [Dryococelus australis]|uniref:Uncharacterized protein n=1 Tax=Dryococelus australis TaxID=614101 RepID=A0ABQ9IGP1_9NEOP|nr:hypothetical protein PR048_000978 [Dryococelus australis]
MIIKDMQPFSVIEGGFRELVAALEPSYQLPSRSVLTRTLLPERHTAQYLAAELKRVASEWELSNKLTAIVTDNAHNISAAVKTNGWTHLPCFAYSINLVVQGGLKTVSTLHRKVKTVVEHFHRSTVAAEKLRSLQKQMRPDARICEVQEFVEAALGILHNPVEALSVEEWAIIKELCNILKPFELVTVELSSKKDISVPKISRASFSDPRFKTNALRNDTALTSVKSSVLADIVIFINAETVCAYTEDINTVSCNVRPNSDTNFDIWQDFDSRLEHVKVTPTATAMVELHQYVSEC